MFVITENIMKRPVYYIFRWTELYRPFLLWFSHSSWQLIDPHFGQRLSVSLPYKWVFVLYRFCKDIIKFRRVSCSILSLETYNGYQISPKILFSKNCYFIL